MRKEDEKMNMMLKKANWPRDCIQEWRVMLISLKTLQESMIILFKFIGAHLSTMLLPVCNPCETWESNNFFCGCVRYVRWVEFRKMLLNGKERETENEREEAKKERKEEWRRQILEDKFIQHIHAKKLQKNQLHHVKQRDKILRERQGKKSLCLY